MEESISLDELVQLYETTIEKNNRLLKTMAAAMGADVSDDGDSSSGDKHHLKAWQVDPQVGGEVEPIFGEEQAASLPINLGYSIIE
jgi:hypothetical protein